MVSPDRADQDQQIPSFDRELRNDNISSSNSGKPFNGLSNLDELLKNVIAVEDGSSSSSSTSAASYFRGNFNLNGTLSTTTPTAAALCKKTTVDEVWKDIVQHQENLNINIDHNNNDNHEIIHHHHKHVAENTTLEDFLVRAGVINVGNHHHQIGVLNPPPIMAVDPGIVPADWFKFQTPPQQQLALLDSNNFPASESSVYENPGVEVGYSRNQLPMTMPVPSMSATSSESQVATEKKRRYSDEMMERTIERRQKRMIKNRESAARSRARKQAYTNQLELEVFNMRKTNSWLKKQKEVELLLSADPTSMPRYQLRRTSSASF